MAISITEELALQAAIRKQMDAIVVAATETVQLLQPSGSGRDNVLEKNQIRNVVNVAEESQSVQVVANFILYQIGRGGATGRGWQHNGFGLRVVKDITEPNEPVRQSVAAAMTELAATTTPELGTRAHVELMRHYLGYLNRAFTYATSKSQDPTDNPWKTLKMTTQSAQKMQQGGQANV